MFYVATSITYTNEGAAVSVVSKGCPGALLPWLIGVEIMFGDG